MTRLSRSRAGRRNPLARTAIERLDDRILPANVAMASATAIDARTLSIDYTVNDIGITSIALNVFRSADSTLDAGDVLIGRATLSGPETTPGPKQAVAVSLPGERAPGVDALAPDPANPFVFVVATGPDGMASSASFQKRVLGLVTHGFQLFSLDPTLPAWVTQMADSLEARGYVDAIPFDWAAESGLPIPGQGTAAGVRAAGRVSQALADLQSSGQYPAGTVFDLHLIGHSRGSVVITQALSTIEAGRSTLPLAGGGYWRLTYLDPHPSHAPNEVPFAVANSSIGALALDLANEFQAAAQDPLPLIVPGNAADVQVYYEQTAAAQILETAEESIINPHGTFPPVGITVAPGTRARSLDLTTPGMSHSDVYAWYQANVVPTLGTANPFVAGPIDAPLYVNGYNRSTAVGDLINPLVAYVSSDDPTLSASGLSATIDWGDGSPETAAVVIGTPLTGFFVAAEQIYQRPGTFTYTARIAASGGSRAVATGTVTVSASATLAFAEGPDVVLRREGTGLEVARFTPFGASAAGLSVATADVDGDGVDDVVVGTGRGLVNEVRVYRGGDLSLLRSIRPYARSYRGGVSVAAGDVDGDGRAEVVVANRVNLRPFVKLYRGTDGTEMAARFAPVPLRGNGPALVSALDANRDGLIDVVVTGPRGPRTLFDGFDLTRDQAARRLTSVRAARLALGRQARALRPGFLARIRAGQTPLSADTPPGLLSLFGRAFPARSSAGRPT